MSNIANQNNLQKKFAMAKELLAALADEVRQDILVQLSQAPNGLRVSEIKPIRKLTRPCLSHHIKTLYRCEMIKVYHEGKKNYYYLSLKQERIQEVLDLFEELKNIKSVENLTIDSASNHKIVEL